MPQIKSAIKRVEIAERNRLRNKSTKSAVRTVIKKALTITETYKPDGSGPLAEVQSAISLAFSRIDKAVKTGVIHANTGARRKSRLARTLQSVIGSQPSA